MMPLTAIEPKIYRRLEINPSTGKREPLIGPPYADWTDEEGDYHPGQQSVLAEIFTPHAIPDEVACKDLCCGLAYGKTTIGVDIAQALLSLGPGQCVLFLEPNVRGINRNFLPAWKSAVPASYYEINKYERLITWKPTGASLYYDHRDVTGNPSAAADRLARGPNLTAVIDDESAIGFNLEMYQNLHGRIRAPSPWWLFVTLSTPKIGPYGNMLKLPGHTLLRGRTIDNPYIPRAKIEQLRGMMSEEQFRRECLGELIALEGRIFGRADLRTPFPDGNLNTTHDRFMQGRDWWLLCDLGSATGANVVVQQMDEYSDDPVWVAVADYCPDGNADVSSTFQRLKKEFGTPAAVVAGGDIDTHNNVTGISARQFTTEVFGPGVDVLKFSENNAMKQLNYGRMLYLIRSAHGVRRFTVAENFQSLDEHSKRGVREVLEEYAMRDIARNNEVLPKGSDQPLCHCADALIGGAGRLMAPTSETIPGYDMVG